MHIEVDSHTHTVASGHAYSSLAENVSAASIKGIRLLAITDHGPQMPGAPHFWFFMNMRVIPRVMNGVGILRGVEANILNSNGELDIDEDIHQQMDIVLGSLHEPIIAPTKKSIHTDAVINAMASGKIDVFAHGGNPAFPIDYLEVAKAAAQFGVLIEINNSSFTTSRQGSRKNCGQLAEAVAKEDGLLTFGSDAHIALNVGGFIECLDLVTTLGISEQTVISRNAAAFLNHLSKRRTQVNMDDYRAVLYKSPSPP
ncbi:PHP domain-containing protein [Desulforhopalus sp. 52FAK]